jgi:hypothetical protein
MRDEILDSRIGSVSSSENILDIQNIDISCPVVPVFVCKMNGLFVPHKEDKMTYVSSGN